jgi:DNA-binding response OmpR family regulator
MSGNILVVDDDPKVLEILKKSLRNKGHVVHLATDGREALDAYERNNPDMVILDLMLPDMDGRDVLRQMRSAPHHRNAPVLFLSASTDPDVRVSTLDRGADDFLVKPFSLREFNAKVRKILSRFEDTKVLQQKSRALEDEISERKENYVQINKELQRQLLAMKTLFTVSQDLNRQLDLDALLNGFALTVVGEIQLSSLAVFVKRREKDPHFHLYAVKGFDRTRIEDLQINVDGDFARRLVEHVDPMKIARSEDESWASKLPDVRLALFEFVTPIIVKHKLKGIVFTGPKLNGDDYTQYELNMLKSLSNSAGIGLDNARMSTPRATPNGSPTTPSLWRRR